MKKFIIMVGTLLSIACASQASQRPKKTSKPKETLKIICWKDRIDSKYTRFNARTYIGDINKKNQKIHDKKTFWMGITYFNKKGSEQTHLACECGTGYTKSQILTMLRNGIKKLENSGRKEDTFKYQNNKFVLEKKKKPVLKKKRKKK